MCRQRLGRWTACALAAIAVGSTACTTGPDEPYEWTGTWRGPATLMGITDGMLVPVTARGTVTIVLSQSGASVSGTWATMFPWLPPLSGSVTGTVGHATLTMTLDSTVPMRCVLSAEATRSGEGITGSLRPEDCPMVIQGGFSLAKE
jgi:hypothetical protein